MLKAFPHFVWKLTHTFRGWSFSLLFSSQKIGTESEMYGANKTPFTTNAPGVHSSSRARTTPGTSGTYRCTGAEYKLYFQSVYLYYTIALCGLVVVVASKLRLIYLIWFHEKIQLNREPFFVSALSTPRRIEDQVVSLEELALLGSLFGTYLIKAINPAGEWRLRA